MRSLFLAFWTVLAFTHFVAEPVEAFDATGTVQLRFQNSDKDMLLEKNKDGTVSIWNLKTQTAVVHRKPIRKIHISQTLNPGIEEKLAQLGLGFLPANIHMIDKSPVENMLLIASLHPDGQTQVELWNVGFQAFMRANGMTLRPPEGQELSRLSLSYEHSHQSGVVSFEFINSATREPVFGQSFILAPSTRPIHTTPLNYQFAAGIEADHPLGVATTSETKIRLDNENTTQTFQVNNQSLQAKEISNIRKSIFPSIPKRAANPVSEAKTQQTQNPAPTAQPPTAQNPAPATRAPEEHPQSSEEEMHFSDYITKFKSTLHKTILGQPEAINALMSIENQNLILGEDRLVPEVLMLIGLPGAGKDVSTEGYVRARFTVRHNKPEEDIEKHIFRFPVVKNEHQTSSITGSSPGLIGSNSLSAFNRFLILHSGGKYLIGEKQEGTSTSEYVVENQDWKPGQVLKDYFAPEDAVVYVNELHDWSMDAKNTLLKEFLEKGFSSIGSPGPGLNRIQVPVNIFMASNHGINLITARDRNGNRVGEEPLSFEQMMERWTVAMRDPTKLTDEIAKATPGNPNGGMSAELRDRIPKGRLILLRPMAPSTLLAIVKMKLQAVKKKFLKAKVMGFPRLNLEFSAKLGKFLADYDQMSEEGARPLDSKIKSLIDDTLSHALLDGTLILKDNETLKLDVKKNPDGTSSLLVTQEGSNKWPIPLLMQYTKKEIEYQALSDEEISKLIKLEEELNKRVKGLGDITAKMARDILLAANEAKDKNIDLSKKVADVYAFFGVSSTGKTELGKALHQVLFSTNSNPLIIDFGQIRTVNDLKEKILGIRGRENNSIASDFMDAYDRNSGKLVVILDEVSNANPDVLTALYDLLREPVVRTFSDAKARPMGQAKIIMTGNIGEERYAGIPRNIPESEQYEAARDIYRNDSENRGFLRPMLMKRFTEAFINRIGEDRIYLFGPHTYKTTRELIQFKLLKAMERITKPNPTKRTWDIRFQSMQDYEKTVAAIEKYGFKIWEQGASITRFVDQVLKADIEYQLLKNAVPSGSQVLLVKTEDQNSAEKSALGFQLVVQNREKPWGTKTLNFTVEGKGISRQIRKDPKDLVLTAFHEAGHEVVRKVLLGDKQQSGGITILPGMASVDGQMVRYLGLAKADPVEEHQFTREVVIAELAVLAGGEAGELLTTKGFRHTAGKTNDMQRATHMARTAILRWGLSEKWGRQTISDGQDMDKFIAGLSSSKKRILEQEVNLLIEEGRKLAKEVLIANYKTLFNPIGSQLAVRGEMSGKELLKFYEERESQIIHPDDRRSIQDHMQAFNAKIKLEKPPVNKRDFEFFSIVEMPKSIANIEQMIANRKAQELATADLSPGRKMVHQNWNYTRVQPGSVISQLLQRRTKGNSCRMAHR